MCIVEESYHLARLWVGGEIQLGGACTPLANPICDRSALKQRFDYAVMQQPWKDRPSEANSIPSSSDLPLVTCSGVPSGRRCPHMWKLLPVFAEKYIHFPSGDQTAQYIAPVVGRLFPSGIAIKGRQPTRLPSVELVSTRARSCGPAKGAKSFAGRELRGVSGRNRMSPLVSTSAAPAPVSIW